MPTRLPGLAALDGVDDQPRIVTAQRRGPDQDGVGLGADLVDAVEVGFVRQEQPLRARVVDVAVIT
jgi:hypothetical protein